MNVRSGPGTTHQVVARVHTGQVFRNLRCHGTGSSRWCHVESGDGLISGWVSGHYLQESGATQSTSASLPASNFADGDAGGPDFWEVTGVAAGDFLNIRTGPSTRYSIVARAPNGLTLRNLGCSGTGSSRWCHVQTPDGNYDGWVAGRYLREGAAPAAAGAGIQIPSGSAVAPDLFLRPTGEIEVGWSGGCTVLYNPAGQRIQAGSSCSSAQLTLSDAAVARIR
ncbi:SH3 domain-containing protein [Fluviibacterium sp. DFM31]|uniref:SH3 domain-containing protein n=1 Tax=Meridianimarinicoccus marinus TaxID=3231483 RepID=A0ABV3LB97_9RHOB